MNKLIHILPALRAAFSRNIPVRLQLLPEKEISPSVDPATLVRKDYAKNEQQILSLEPDALSTEKLTQTAEKWLENQIAPPACILIKNTAVLLVNEDRSGHRLSGKICVITGGAQGFGAGIAKSLFEEGASVVIADLNKEKGSELTGMLNRDNEKPNRAIFALTDVSDPESVRQMVDDCVLRFGGLDIMISNAGILNAGSLDEMSPEVFQKVTAVNYNGYFHCVKFASRVMKQQAACNPDMYSDIIQINSKSGLKGSNKNFAYAGGKFGGIGLTQSFALELIPYRIKVNAICPGNFFEGPLWSDPENGLFVQYLKAGKVPGARTLEDVRKHYEKQVPAGRGCRVEDVVTAILYVIEQKYETGQALPVTGGQNMLH